METVAAAASAQAYRPRHPERTVLYRALAHHFDRFLLVYEVRFQGSQGYLRRCVEPAVHRYLDCGLFDQGVARVRCPDRVYEVDPLLCPFCGAEMKVLAFILDFSTARAIRKSLKLPAQEPEPLAASPSPSRSPSTRQKRTA